MSWLRFATGSCQNDVNVSGGLQPNRRSSSSTMSTPSQKDGRDRPDSVNTRST